MKKTRLHRSFLWLSVFALLFGALIFPARAEEESLVLADFPEAEEDSSWYHANETVYDISTAAQLAYFYRLLTFENVSFANKTVRLAADIVWNEGTAGETTFTPASQGQTVYRWTPMGSTKSPGSPFMGVFDGQGHSISGLYMSKTENNVGFFNVVKNCTIKNLSIVNSYLSLGASKWYAGTLAVQAMGSSCRFENIYVEAYHNNGNATQFIGGIVGTVGLDTKTVFTNCIFDGVLTGTAAVGGILGTNRIYQTTMTDCINLGTLNTVKETGGLIGRCSGAAVLTRCHNFGSIQVTNDSYAGALLYLERKNHNTNLTADDGTARVTLTDCYFLQKAFSGGALAMHNGRFWFTVQVQYTGAEAQSHTGVGGTTGEDRIAENALMSAMCRSIVLPKANESASVDILGCQENRGRESYKLRVVGMRLTDSALPDGETPQTESQDTVGFSVLRLNEEGLSSNWQEALTDEALASVDADYGATEVQASDHGAESFFTLVEENLPYKGMEIFVIRPYEGDAASRLYGDCVMIVYVNGAFVRADRL